MRIAYILASRSRPEKFFSVLENIRHLSASNDYFILAKADLDDHTMNNDAIRDRMEDYPELTVKWGHSDNKTHAINRDIEDLPPFDVLVCMSDDMVFTVPGFDNIIRQHAHGDNFLHFPDSYKKAACSTMSIMTRQYWERFKYIYHPSYNSLWCDVEATEVAKLLGCYKYIPQQIFEHRHYSTGEPKDALYKRNDTYKRDRANYLNRRIENFGLDIPSSPFLLIKYPTRGRWRQFAEGIDNIYSTIKTNRFKILVTADEDDCEMNSPEVRDICKRYHNVEILYGHSTSKIDACNRDINRLQQWDWSVLYSDDMRFKEFGWDEKMLEQIREVWPQGWDFFAHFNDGYAGKKLPTMNICGRAWFERFGYLYHPSYKSVSCDAENMFVAQMLGRYAYFDTVYFTHEHPANLKQPSDYIYRRNHALGSGDTDNYFQRLKRYFDVSDPLMIPDEMKPYL
jgi:hypothetical protein